MKPVVLQFSFFYGGLMGDFSCVREHVALTKPNKAVQFFDLILHVHGLTALGLKFCKIKIRGNDKIECN